MFKNEDEQDYITELETTTNNKKRHPDNKKIYKIQQANIHNIICSYLKTNVFVLASTDTSISIIDI